MRLTAVVTAKLWYRWQRIERASTTSARVALEHAPSVNLFHFTARKFTFHHRTAVLLFPLLQADCVLFRIARHYIALHDHDYELCRI